MQIKVHLFNDLNRTVLYIIRMMIYMGYSTGLGIISNIYPAVDQRKPTLIGNKYIILYKLYISK